jgi:hypothetical protein
VVTNVGLIGAPGAWVALGGVYVLEHVRGALLGSWGWRHNQMTERSDRDTMHAQGLLRSKAHPWNGTAVPSKFGRPHAKFMLCVFSLGPCSARVILWELGLHEQRHNIDALNRVDTAGTRNGSQK